MKEKMIRFMQGRYGADTLSKFLLICGLVVGAVILLFLKRQYQDVLLYFGMGVDHLLLLPDVFQKHNKTLCRESGISCTDL